MIILLCPIGRTGSFFLQSLLSDHPEILTSPGSGLSNAVLSCLCLQKSGQTTFSQLYTSFLDYQFDPVHLANGGLMSHKVDAGSSFLYQDVKPLLEQSIKAHPLRDKYISEIGLFSSLQQILQSHDNALGLNRSASPKSLLLLIDSVTTLKHALSILKCEPAQEFKTIIMGRELIDNVESIVNFAFSQSANPFKVYNHLYSFRNLPALASSIPSYMPITLEALKDSPEITMTNIAEYLGVTFHPNMLLSTFAGAPYGTPKTTRNPGISGFKKSKPISTSISLCSNDIAQLKLIFSGYNAFFGYHSQYNVDPLRHLALAYQSYLSTSFHFKFSELLIARLTKLNPSISYREAYVRCISREFSLLGIES
jgi:hypothetical protein